MLNRQNPPIIIPEPRFDECRECKFYRHFHTSVRCKGCGIGENFEEIIKDFDADFENFGNSFREND